MRVAIIADIHGNVLALESVMARLRDDAPDLVVNLGDCVSGPLWPRETADALMALDWLTVQGNHDRWVAVLGPGEGAGSDGYARAQLDDKHIAWLRDLPPVARRDDMLLFHGRPDDDNAYLLETVSETGEMIAASRAAIEQRLGGERAPLILCGHSHLPRIAQVSDGAIIVNPGSVGCPGYHDPTPPLEHWSEAGSPHARYAIATLRGSEWSIDLRAVVYAWDDAARRAAENGRAEWARVLATGFIR